MVTNVSNSCDRRRALPSAVLLQQHLLIERLLASRVKALASGLELTYTQAVVLACIYRLEQEEAEAVIAVRLSWETGLTKAQVSTTLGSLEELELVSRERPDDSDGRMSHLCLTPRGVQRAELVVSAMQELELELRNHMKVTGRSSHMDRLARRLRRR
jgi:DNA-binding MarR family transcriptional regulator